MLIFCVSDLFCQNYDDEVGSVHLSLTSQQIISNKDGLPTTKVTNKKNLPYLKLDFDSVGSLLKSESFGKHHNPDLRLTDKIEVFEYRNGLLFKSIEYESDYNSKVYPYFRTEYVYNDSAQLVDESTYYFESDSLFFQTTFVYDAKNNRTKSIFNPTYYYLREFDSLNQITSLKQIYDNKIRWDWTYSYTDSTRTGKFQTYYSDGKNNSKTEIRRYIGSQLIEVEEIGIIHSLKKFEYYENGLIQKISEYRKTEYLYLSSSERKLINKVNSLFKATDDFEPIQHTEILCSSEHELSSEVISRLNSKIDW
ncbi:hypothetical protein [Marinoscillum sp. MHG1-6]|uniref:hypothetical protein n=1 Tax=Marinoscillum sp. MHG1-6 TaxID=2959627 RepID=UPI002157281B|nr:hypothetical protein [Marinoscillum sp. MHG1-6]